MKNKAARIISMLMAVIMVMGMIPFSVFAADTSMTVNVEAVNAMPGETVEVDITLADNPGISSLRMNVRYGDILTLTKVTYNKDFGGQFVNPQTLTSPVTLYWLDYSSSCDVDGVFATLTFVVSDSAKADEVANITVTYDPDDIYDFNMDNVDTVVNPGSVTVLPCVAGDINSDGKSNNKDATTLARFLAEWQVDINAHCIDVNGDGKVNNKDLTRLFQYLANWDVEIWCKCGVTKRCIHEMTEYPAKDANCTEDGNINYWYCSLCEKYFLDVDGAAQTTYDAVVIEAYGHTEEIIPAVDPTYEEGGWTEGKKCTVCGTVIKAPEPIDTLKKDEYYIDYRINRPYIESVGVDNPNPDRYTKQDGLILKELESPGFKFLGWYTKSSGGELVERIPVGNTGDMLLYAHWETEEPYKVQFDSPDIPWNNNGRDTYTVETGLTLDNPKCFGYTFVGWSLNGEIVSSIEPGTTGNITLHANWTSNRNRAISYKDYGSPAIVEDLDNNQYLFIYEIGQIIDVPLSEVPNTRVESEGIVINQTYEATTAVDEGHINKAAQAVSNATTKTSSWTLSSEWNEQTSATNSNEETKGKTKEKTDSQGNVISSQYYVSNSTGGATSSSSSASASSSSCSKVTTDTSTGFSGVYKDSSETTSSVTLEAGASVKAGVKYGVASVEAEVSTKATTNDSQVDKTSSDVSISRDTYVGTYDENNSSASWNSSSTSSSSWNSSSSYQNSKSASTETSVSEAVSEAIKTSYGITSSNGVGGGESNTTSTGDTMTSNNEYSSTIEYSTETATKLSQTLTTTSDEEGWYRIITTGNMTVFGVVGYDIATNSYFTYTYNVLEPERRMMVDFSRTSSLFNDCENGLIPFEIPYDVHDFVTGVIGKSSGLVIHPDTGVVDEYNAPVDENGVAETESYIVVPEYASSKSSSGYSAARVTAIAPSAFAGKENIKGIILPKYVTNIPEGAFKGCTNLETVIGYSISSIGKDAFAGCENLKTFTVDKYIGDLGETAFVDCPEVVIKTGSTDVANNAYGCGAKKITVDVSDIKEYDIRNITIPNTCTDFTFVGNGGEYKDLSIVSDAIDTTALSNITFVENSGIPMNISSKALELSRVNVINSPGFALRLTGNDTTLKLYSTNELASAGDNAVLSRNVSLSKVDAGAVGELKLTGNYLVCGIVTNDGMLGFTDKDKYGIVVIDENEYNTYLNSVTVTLDADGGSGVPASVLIPYGGKYGDLPTPTKENYVFLGWFAEGLWATSGTDALLYDHTLKALWHPASFKITFNANGGTVTPEEVTRYYDSVFGDLPVPTREHYRFDGWFTEAEGGTQITADMLPESATDITLYAHWTLCEFTLNFNANGGSVSQEIKTVIHGEAVGTLPIPTRSGCTFDGWYTPDGVQVTEDTVYEVMGDTTLRAYWTSSDWVLESTLPSDATPDEESAVWRYDLTVYKKHTTNATEDGYTQYNSYWEKTGSGSVNYASFPSGFNTSHWIYQNFAKNPYSGYENTAKKRVVSNSWAGYVYWHWMYNVHYANTTTRAISSKSGTYSGLAYSYFYALTSSTNCPYLDNLYCNNQNLPSYNCSSILPSSTGSTDGMGTPRFFRFDYYVSSYTDYTKYYDHKKIEKKESASAVTAGGDISNVQKWVKYTVK